MKGMKLCSLLATGLLAFGLVQTSMGETILLDLGNNDTYRGISVSSPDLNGNYWNSVGYGYMPGLVDTAGNGTTIAYAPDGIGGTDSYNGPAGPTDDGFGGWDPSTVNNTAINPAALGNLGVTNAAYDFFVDGAFQIQGLDNTKTYNLTIFGSHKYDIPGVATYEIHNNNAYTNVVASTTLAYNDDTITGNEWDHNQDRVATITGVSPQEFDILYFKYSGYVNAISIEAVPEPATIGLIAIFGAGLLAVRRKYRA